MRRPDPSELAAGIRAGDRAALARAITLAESLRADDRERAQALLLSLDTGGAQRVGLTGVPGAGKSTLIETLGLRLIERGHRVAVLVVDPSSTRSGGSILGDRTRMQRLALSDDAYIRPSPSSGVLGGVARRTREAIELCEAAGFDVVIVESVGVGQSETLLAELVDCLCLLLVPGAGDELQGIKRGIVELADLVVVNKADGPRAGEARRAATDYRHALRLLQPATPGWTTPVLTASAAEGTGIDELWDAVERHRAHGSATGQRAARRVEQRLAWLRTAVDEAVLNAFHARAAGALAAAERAVLAGELTVPQAVARVTDAP